MKHRMRGKTIIAGSLTDFHLFGLGLRSFLESMPDVSYAGKSGRGNLSVFLQEYPLDILFISGKNDEIVDGTLIQKIRSIDERIKIAVFIDGNDNKLLRQLIESKVDALLMKTAEQIELEYAIKVIMDKGLFISQEISSKMFYAITDNRHNDFIDKIRQYQLTSREVQVLSLLFREFSNREIADKLKISTRTVEAHRTNILNKTGIKNSVGLAKFVLENKLDRQLAFMQTV